MAGILPKGGGWTGKKPSSPAIATPLLVPASATCVRSFRCTTVVTKQFRPPAMLVLLPLGSPRRSPHAIQPARVSRSAAPTLWRQTLVRSQLSQLRGERSECVGMQNRATPLTPQGYVSNLPLRLGLQICESLRQCVGCRSPILRSMPHMAARRKVSR